MNINEEAFKTIRKRKGAEILGSLVNGAKLVSEVQAQVGGSMGTIYKRIEEFEELGMIERVHLDRAEFGHLAPNARLLRLTKPGEAITKELSYVGLVREPLLSKQRQRWILLHLFKFGEVKGRTRFQKLLYLQKYELESTEGSFYSFKWDRYGPFSKEILGDLEDLVDKGLISVKTDEVGMTSDTRHLFTYNLTKEGRDLISGLLEQLHPRTLDTLDSLREFNEMPLDRLLKYVYERFGRTV